MNRIMLGTRFDAWAAVGAACAVLVAAIAAERMVTVARAQLIAPYDLASEGPQLASIDVIRSGLNPYSPDVFDGYPFVLTFYTPLYYYIVNAFAGQSHPVFAARAISLTCMIAAGFIPLLIGLRRSPITGILATAVFFLCWPVTINAAFAKNDSLALLLGASAVWSAWTIPTSWGTILSAALGLAAFMAKQSFVSPLISIAIYLFLADKQRLRAFVAEAACLGIVTVIACTAIFGGGFWTSLLAQRSHPMSFSMVTGNFRAFFEQPLVAVAVVTALATLGRHMPRPHDRAAIASYTYAAVSCGMVFVFIGKAGAATNCFMEFVLALCLAIVCCDQATADLCKRPMLFGITAAVLAIAAMFDAVVVHPGHFDLTRASFNEDRSRLMQERASLLRATAGRKPRVLNLGNAQHTFELPGRISLSDPYCQLLIYRSGGLSIDTLIAAVERQQFDVVVSTPGMVRWLADERNNLTALLDAASRNYPVRRQHAGILVFTRGNDGK